MSGPVTEDELKYRYGTLIIPPEALESVFRNYVDYDGLALKVAEAVSVRPDPRQSNHFHSSQDLDPDKCLRQTVYSLNAETPSNDTYNPEYHLSTVKGDLIHAEFQKAFELSGLTARFDGPGYEDSRGFATEVDLNAFTVPRNMLRLMKRLNLSGRMDCVVWWRGRYWILDIKTVSNEKLYDEKKAVWWLKNVVHYLYQVRFYSLVYGLPTGERVPRTLIYVINRDNLRDTRLYASPAADDMLTLSLSAVEKAEILRKAGQYPPRKVNQFYCTHMCDYRDLCDPFNPHNKGR